MFELIKEEIDGLVFGVGKTIDERENFIESIHSEAVSSDFQFFLYFFSRLSTHFDFFFLTNFSV